MRRRASPRHRRRFEVDPIQQVIELALFEGDQRLAVGGHRQAERALVETLVVQADAGPVELCGAAHKSIHVEHPVMWSDEPAPVSEGQRGST